MWIPLTGNVKVYRWHLPRRLVFYIYLLHLLGGQRPEAHRARVLLDLSDGLEAWYGDRSITVRPDPPQCRLS